MIDPGRICYTRMREILSCFLLSSILFFVCPSFSATIDDFLTDEASLQNKIAKCDKEAATLTRQLWQSDLTNEYAESNFELREDLKQKQRECAGLRELANLTKSGGNAVVNIQQSGQKSDKALEKLESGHKECLSNLGRLMARHDMSCTDVAVLSLKECQRLRGQIKSVSEACGDLESKIQAAKEATANRQKQQQAVGDRCPEDKGKARIYVTINGPSGPQKKGGEPVTFTANVPGEEGELRYDWTIRGQHGGEKKHSTTNKRGIRVHPSQEGSFTVTVKVSKRCRDGRTWVEVGPTEPYVLKVEASKSGSQDPRDFFEQSRQKMAPEDARTLHRSFENK